MLTTCISKPFNNSFTKWVGDLVTENRVLINHREHLPELYFNIIEREEKKVFLPIDTGRTQRIRRELWRFHPAS